MCFGFKVFRQIGGIPIGTNCALLITELFLLKGEWSDRQCNEIFYMSSNDVDVAVIHVGHRCLDEVRIA